MKALISFLIFMTSLLCCYSQSSVMGAPRQFAAPRATFNEIISIGELIKSVKEATLVLRRLRKGAAMRFAGAITTLS